MLPGLPVVHDRQLPALAHVARVGQQLAHELDDGLATNQVCALLAVRREQHVAGLQRHGLRHGHRFLAEGAHVEGDLSLALRALHAVVEDARVQHVAQPDLQVFVFEARIPRTHGLVFVVEHAHQAGGAIFHVTRAGADLRPGDRCRRATALRRKSQVCRPAGWAVEGREVLAWGAIIRGREGGLQARAGRAMPCWFLPSVAYCCWRERWPPRMPRHSESGAWSGIWSVRRQRRRGFVPCEV